jgi:iron(III) transport system ATP-binding protein
MSLLSVERLRKGFGGQPVLRDAALDLPAGAILALLGASGCGKTTLLRLIAGFEAADSGRITLDGRVLDDNGTHVPAERRHIGYVPQEGTLFPHLTVAGNVGFGLTRAERRSGRIEEALRLTGLAALADRYPHQISGGQQQRAALARALAPRPRLVLLDEPFNALDLDLRRTVCAEVIATLRAAGATALLVTHDPQEAFASADLLAVMEAGVIVQSGDPATAYHAPLTPAVARLTGETIFLDAEHRGGVAETALGPLAIRNPATAPAGPTTALLRPEQIMPAADGTGAPARVTGRQFRGDHTLVTADLGTLHLQFRAGPGFCREQQVVHLGVAGACTLFPREPRSA